MFKKLLVVAVACATLLGANAFAADNKIDVVKYSRPGGLTDRMNANIAAALGDRFGEFIQVKGCGAAKKVIMNSNRTTVAAWDTQYFADQSDGTDGPCSVPEKNFLGTLANAPYYVCHMAENTTASIEHLKTGNVKVAVWDSAFYAVPQEQFINSINPAAKVIRYKTKPFKTALPSGEVDYKMSTIPSSGEKCIVVLGNTDEGLVTGKSLSPDSPFAEFGYSYTVIGNVPFNKAQFMNNILNSTAWAERKDQKYQSWNVGMQGVKTLLRNISAKVK